MLAIGPVLGIVAMVYGGTKVKVVPSGDRYMQDVAAWAVGDQVTPAERPRWSFWG
ncbi:MAG: hypothetical protein WEB88_15310 [Gemmatimonadota bacterium]